MGVLIFVWAFWGRLDLPPLKHMYVFSVFWCTLTAIFLVKRKVVFFCRSFCEPDGAVINYTIPNLVASGELKQVKSLNVNK